MLQKLFFIAIAGGLGSLARYGLSGVFQRWFKAEFPWGTALVNILGCFLLGLIWAASTNRWTISSDTRTIILVGFLGAFTTFSTFVNETGQLLIGSELLLGIGNIFLQVAVGLIVFFIGVRMGKII